MPTINAHDFPDFTERKRILQRASQVITEARELLIRLDLEQDLSSKSPNPHLLVQVSAGKAAPPNQPRA